MDTAQYKLLLDTAQVGWWEIDFDKRVYICSDYLVSLLELKDKIIPTRDFLQLIREDYRARIANEFAYFREVGIYEQIFPIKTCYGFKFVRSKICKREIEPSGRVYVLGILQLVPYSEEETNKPATEGSQVDGLLRHLGSISRALHSFIQTNDLVESIQLVLTEILFSIDTKGRACIMEYSDDKQRLSCTYEVCSKGVAAVRSSLQNIPVSTLVWSTRKIRNLYPVMINNLNELPEDAESEKMYPFLTEFPKEERDWFLKIYQRICKKADRLVTVSEFSKQRIHALLGVPDEKIAVIGNGWQHFNGVTPDMRIFEQYPQLKRKKYFFTLTSVNRNKNLDWVLKAAENNPQAQFAAAGRKLDSAVDFSQYPNVTYVEDVSDCEIKALMQEAKAFIFPSFYEGFGIPPLEAMSVGTPVIVSHAASLPEIFGTAAHYIEPDNPRVDIEKLLAQPVSEKEPVLARYSWEKSAEKLLSLLKEN